MGRNANTSFNRVVAVRLFQSTIWAFRFVVPSASVELSLQRK